MRPRGFACGLLILLGALPAAAAAATPQPPEKAAADRGLAAVRSFREANAARILADFSDLLSLPNVMGDRPNIAKNVAWLRTAFEKRGAKLAVWEPPGEGSPVLFGRLDTPGAKRTLGVYVHYDGQPVDRESWTSPPFSPTLRSAALENGGQPLPLPKPGERIDPEWRLYARSAGDDKAPLIAVLTALDALKQAKIPLTSNLLFLFEGEEEHGSDHLEAFLTSHKNQLKVDAWLFCDGPVHTSRRPQLVFGVRGVVDMDLTVYGAVRHLHSGHYGNWAPNPAFALAHLLASMKDEEGHVQIESFYDTVEPLGPAERAAIEAIKDNDDELRKELGLVETEDNNARLQERLLLPTLNIRGLLSGSVGQTAENIIPATASASIELRLVKGNDPSHMLDLLEEHIRKQGYFIVREDPDMATRLAHARIAKVVRHPGYPAARTAMDLDIVFQIVQATSRAAGENIILLPTLGGSLPLYLFNDLLAQPAVIVPIANHDDKQHGPDENLRLANLWYGIDLMGELLSMPK
ncbi:MAG TPA: M20/M25/M40 family metallo-hydrolase [Thermoanaerobaculia bacterium]|nr:M20/M25/M40 family metallo-hydrolase [Thermoanaerobaculia bacterium]